MNGSQIDAVIRELVFEPEPFAGPVERREPASYQRRSIHYTCRCEASHCREWVQNGAWKLRRCNFCRTTLPDWFLGQFR